MLEWVQGWRLTNLLLVFAVGVGVIVARAGVMPVVRVGVVAIVVALGVWNGTGVALQLATDGQGTAVLLAVLFLVVSLMVGY